MKLSNKLILPCMALSLITSSAFAGRRPCIVEPSLGNLAAITICNAMAGAATYIAVDKLISNPLLKIPCKILATGYWLNSEYEAIKEYQNNKAQWELHQAIKKLSTHWNSLSTKFKKRTAK